MTTRWAAAGPDAEPEFCAATVVLVRDGEDGLECLMLRKSLNQAFGGAWVFPGGRVEDLDGSGLQGARRAAVRELREEARLTLEPGSLLPFAHWTPPPDATRRYATWFFMAAAPQGASAVVTDGVEIEDHIWTTPGAAFAAHRRGELQLLPPTWLTLYRLSRYADADTSLRDAAAEPVQRFATRIVDHGGIPVALWSPDVAFPVEGSGPSCDLDGPGPRHRLYMDPAGWRYERSHG